jgi:hypothetical protein
MADWNNIPTLDRLRLTDSSKYPLPGTIVLCLMCGKPFLMRRYSGYPDQVCPECYGTYRDCASLHCSVCKVVVAKVKPSVLPSGFYVRPGAVLHLDHCPICRPPRSDIKEGDVACMATVVEIRRYEEQFGASRKILVAMPGTRTEDIK